MSLRQLDDGFIEKIDNVTESRQEVLQEWVEG